MKRRNSGDIMASTETLEKTMAPAPTSPVSTQTLEASGLMAAVPQQIAFRQAWLQANEKISMMRFVRYPDLEAEGLQPPVAKAIYVALNLADIFVKMGTLPP